jgi:hypothetical protein
MTTFGVIPMQKKMKDDKKPMPMDKGKKKK